MEKIYNYMKKSENVSQIFQRNKAKRGIYRYSLYSTLISIHGCSNI